MMKIFTDGKRDIITAAMFYAAALAAALCCGCSDYNIPAAFMTPRTEHVTKSTFTDPRPGGQTYKTVRLWNKTWMAENLNYETDNSWCYNDDSSNCNIYGRLYTWNAAKSACQGMGSGWHLPSSEEWSTLERYAGGWEAGKRLKSTSGWKDDGNGTDDFGFSALPGGYRYDGGGVNFGGAGGTGVWWSSTERYNQGANRRRIYGSSDSMREHHPSPFEFVSSHGFSVRCVTQN